MEAPVFNIQRFCLYDGDGIRTTFFFKGCPLKCKWCHNPESQAGEPQMVFSKKKCTGCGGCDRGCIYGAREIAGKLYSVDELIRIAERDAEFYKSSGGGITLSGGEVMIQPRDFLLALMGGLKQKGFNLAVDTCGYAPFEAFESALPYVDTFLYDVKFIDSSRHLQFTGEDNSLILSNLKKLSHMGAKLEIRIPVIEGANSDDVEMRRIAAYIAQNIKVEKVRLLPYHTLGKEKYEQLGMTASDEFSAPSARRMQELTEMFMGCGVQVC